MPQFLKVANAADAPVPLTAVTTHCRHASIIARKTLDGLDSVVNAGPVAIGHSVTTGEQPIVLGPGDERTIWTEANQMFDLKSLFLKVATDGDGVVVVYH